MEKLTSYNKQTRLLNIDSTFCFKLWYKPPPKDTKNSKESYWMHFSMGNGEKKMEDLYKILFTVSSLFFFPFHALMSMIHLQRSTSKQNEKIFSPYFQLVMACFCNLFNDRKGNRLLRIREVPTWPVPSDPSSRCLYFETVNNNQ